MTEELKTNEVTEETVDQTAPAEVVEEAIHESPPEESSEESVQQEPIQTEALEAESDPEDTEEEEDEEELTQEEQEELEREQAKIDKIQDLVDKRCLVMSMCLSGSIEVVMDAVDDDLKQEKVQKACIDISQMSHFGGVGTGMADYTKSGLLTSAVMMAAKIFETVVPQPKPKDVSKTK